MEIRKASIIALAALSSAVYAQTCGKLQKKEVSYYDNLQQTQVTRSYLIYLPKQYCQAQGHYPRAVIYGLHGFYGTASGFALSTTEGSLNKLADEKDLIMVYPQGKTLDVPEGPSSGYDTFYSSWNFLISAYHNPDHQADSVFFNGKDSPICNLNKMSYNPIPPQPGCHVWKGTCAWTSCYDDAGYLLAVQKAVENQFQADSKKQYLIGISNGAMMVYRMACQYPQKFQAAVSIAGTSMRHMQCYAADNDQVKNPYLQNAQTSLLIFVGKRDRVVPLTKAQESEAKSNHYHYENANELIDNWAKQLSCKKQQNINEPLLDGVKCRQYSECKPGNNSVAFCIWGNNKNKTIADHHNYPGAAYGTGYCVSQLQHKLAKDYPICSKVTPKATAEQGTAFMYQFLVKHTI